MEHISARPKKAEKVFEGTLHSGTRCQVAQSKLGIWWVRTIISNCYGTGWDKWRTAPMPELTQDGVRICSTELLPSSAKVFVPT